MDAWVRDTDPWLLWGSRLILAALLTQLLLTLALFEQFSVIEGHLSSIERRLSSMSERAALFDERVAGLAIVLVRGALLRGDRGSAHDGRATRRGPAAAASSVDRPKPARIPEVLRVGRVGTMMNYKGYTATVEFDDSVGRLHGRVVNSAPYPIATFEATDVDGIRREFRRSIDEYLTSCDRPPREVLVHPAEHLDQLGARRQPAPVPLLGLPRRAAAAALPDLEGVRAEQAAPAASISSGLSAPPPGKRARVPWESIGRPRRAALPVQAGSVGELRSAPPAAGIRRAHGDELVEALDRNMARPRRPRHDRIVPLADLGLTRAGGNQPHPHKP